MATSPQQKIEELTELYKAATSKEEIEQIDAAIQRQSALAKEGAVTQHAKDFDSPFLAGIGSGMERVGNDLYDAGTYAAEHVGLADDGSFDEARADTMENRAEFDPLKEQQMSASVGEGLGEVVSTLPLGGVTGVGKTMLGRLAGNAGLGAVAGTLGADDQGEGAMWGAGGGAAGEVLAGAGRLFGKKAPNVVKPKGFEDVPILRADDQKSIYGTMEHAAEQSPLARGDIIEAREGQQEAIKDATGRLIGKYSANAGAEAVEKGMQNIKAARKATAGRLYDEVGEEMDGILPGLEWKEGIEAMVKKEKALPDNLQDKALIKQLENYADTGQWGGGTVKMDSRPATGKLSQTPGRGLVAEGVNEVKLPDVERNMDWNQLRQLRSVVGRDIGDTYGAGAQVGTRQTPKLMEAKELISRSLDDAGTESGLDKWGMANEYYSDKIVAPYKTSPSVVKGIMNKETPQQMVEELSRPQIANNKELVGSVLSSMDMSGRNGLRKELLTKAFEVGEEGTMSPAKAATFIKQRKELFKQALPDENIDDIIRLLETVKGAGTVGNMPPTGYTAGIAQGVKAPALAALGGAAAGGALYQQDPQIMAAGAGAGAGSSLLVGSIMAALATGKPGAIGKALRELGKYGGAAGRLSGAAMPTEE